MNPVIRMDDVAAKAGVSVTTVSHVLNGVPGKRIRPETRDRVRRVAEEMGYVLNGVARSLRTRRSHVIAMIGDEVAITPFAFGIILGAQEAASKRGWLLVHVTTGVDRSLEAAEIQLLRERQVDGFLYARMYNREVVLPDVLKGLPAVIVDGTSSDPAVSSICPDEFGGALAATRELIRHGHTRIGFINNIDDIPAARGRLAGYRAAVEEAGLPLRPDFVVRAFSDAYGGLRAAAELLDGDDPPQAIFAFNDRMAMGVYHAAQQRGLRIPEDLSVVGFDNQMNISDSMFPRLTTVALPHSEMGAWGVRTLLDQLDRPDDTQPTQVALACPLIRRESVAPPRTGAAPTPRARARSTRSTPSARSEQPGGGPLGPDGEGQPENHRAG